jgi:hypothetical protein
VVITARVGVNHRHRAQKGIGQIGAGIVRTPMACYTPRRARAGSAAWRAVDAARAPSPRGMVTAPHHLAAQSGVAVLRDGGNAVER